VETIEIDITNLTPRIALPPKPDNVVAVSEVKDVAVDSIFIGSCTNGRYEDFAVVAEIVKGKKVAPGVMARAVPATREIYGQMLADGIIATMYEAGFIISNPGCGGCASGQIGMTGSNEVQISTSNRNFKGKQGDGATYLASPATAAASALAGKIVAADLKGV
ncbi:homoaconitate hydratase family protein, partial [bacterium]|nr:homoaconitate hydratase family protein [bacterium]